MNYKDINKTLEQVRGEISGESKVVHKAAKQALMTTADNGMAEKVMMYAEKLAFAARELKAICDFLSILQKELQCADSNVRKLLDLSHKKTNFTVAFPNGKTISAPKAKTVFAKAIEEMGASSVAKLDIRVGGEPLVTQDASELKKYPVDKEQIAGGWYVMTHSSTDSKVEMLLNLAKELNLTLDIRFLK